MMNKKNIIIVIAVIVLLGGGGYFLLQNKSGSSQNAVVTSIKDALSQSVSMECTYTDDEGRESKSYIKNGSIRSDFKGKTAEETGSTIVTEKKMYVWNGKEGFMMDIPDVTPTEQESSNPDSNPVARKDEMMADLEKYKESCKTAVVPDSLFTPPSDVQFTDYSQMMQQIQMPVEGSGMSEEQIQQYQQLMQENANSGQ